MAVQNGSPVEANYTNSRLVSRTEDSNTIGRIDLNNADAASGDQITNIQAVINEARSERLSAQTISGSGEFTLKAVRGTQYARVVSDGGSVTASTTPFGSSPSDGTLITLVGGSDTDTVTIPFADVDFGCFINGDMTLSLGRSITLIFFGDVNRWYELARNV